MKLIFGAVLAATALTGAAWAEDISKTNQNRVPPSNEGRLVCKGNAPTGSRIGGSICRTGADWARKDRDSRTSLNQTRFHIFLGSH